MRVQGRIARQGFKIKAIQSLSLQCTNLLNEPCNHLKHSLGQNGFKLFMSMWTLKVGVFQKGLNTQCKALQYVTIHNNIEFRKHTTKQTCPLLCSAMLTVIVHVV